MKHTHMESGGGNWSAEGGWTLATNTAHSSITAWAGEPITLGMPLTLTLQVPLDLSTERRARLTFWYSQTLSAEAAEAEHKLRSTHDGKPSPELVRGAPHTADQITRPLRAYQNRARPSRPGERRFPRWGG